MNTIDSTAVWEQSLQLLLTMEETKSPMAQVYLSYLVPKTLDEHQFSFSIRLSQAKQWIEERYLSLIEEAISTVVNSPRKVLLILDESSFKQLSPSSPAPAGVDIAQPAVSVAQPITQPIAQPFSQPAVQTTVSPVMQPSASPLDTLPPVSLSSDSLIPGSTPHTVNAVPHTSLHEPVGMGTGLSSVFAPDTLNQTVTSADPESRFNFSNYVMGDSNEFAYKASLRVAESPGIYFNPLFIYGKSGLGKTHLLLSIRNYIRTYLPEKRVVYAPTTEFVNDFTNAVARDRDLTSFKRIYHTCDVLLIDDVQNLEGKEGTTDALFEIFNIFINSRKQIVLSADRSPIEINLDERFTSRFAQGITADIQPPNYEMKTAILKNCIRYHCGFLNIQEVPFSDDAIQKIVELSGSNIRELDGAVSNLIAYVSFRPDSQKNTPITYNDVETVLGKTFFHKNTRNVDISMIMRAVESYFNVSHTELISDKRSKNISHPRQVAMYLIRRYTDMSYPEIGVNFNKDHTTVMYADKICTLQETVHRFVNFRIQNQHS